MKTGTKHNRHNTNKSRVSLLYRLKCDRPSIAQSKNIHVITELIITTLFDQVLKVSYWGPLCLPKKVVHISPTVAQLAYF
jgi:hypothetical protein